MPDEFSFAYEHIEDEPSIHIKSIAEFKSILSKFDECKFYREANFENRE